jgi:hypothetical protein
MRTVARIATATATITALAGLSLAGATPALAECGGTPIDINDYGVCIENSKTTVPGQVVWTPGVPKQYVNTPGILFIPPQSFGTPIVPSQGVTVPTITIDAVKVTPCTGSC